MSYFKGRGLRGSQQACIWLAGVLEVPPVAARGPLISISRVGLQPARGLFVSLRGQSPAFFLGLDGMAEAMPLQRIVYETALDKELRMSKREHMQCYS